MKIIKIIFLILLALGLIVCTGIFIFFQTFDTDQFLPKITQKASLVLGRPVAIKGVWLGLSWRGITLDAGPVIVADNIAFTKQPFITIDKVSFSPDLRALIFQRKIHITEILLQSPQIHFIRNQDAKINVQGIGAQSLPAGDKAVTMSNAVLGITVKPPENVFLPAHNLSSKEHASLPAINGMTIKIQDASISFIDQSPTFPLDIWLKDINAKVSDFSFSQPFQFSFNASPLVLKGIAIGTPDSPLAKNISGAVQFDLAHLGPGASGLEANGKVTVTDGVIKNFNIIRTVLSHTLVVFGAMENIIDKLGGEDTIIEKVQAAFSIHDNTVVIDDSSIKTNLFELTAKGSIDQGLNTDMQTILHLNEDVSATLVNEFDGLKLLCDDSKRIAVDASLEGVFPHLKYKPNKDFRKKSKKLLMQEGGNILGVLLGDKISIQGDGDASPKGKKIKINLKNIFKNFWR